MSIGEVRHSGFISSIHYTNLTPWYVTQKENEIIEFKDNNIQYELNSLTIISENTPFYVRFLPSEYCEYIPANSVLTYTYTQCKSIQIMGNIGIQLRWSGNYK